MSRVSTVIHFNTIEINGKISLDEISESTSFIKKDKEIWTTVYKKMDELLNNDTEFNKSLSFLMQGVIGGSGKERRKLSNKIVKSKLYKYTFYSWDLESLSKSDANWVGSIFYDHVKTSIPRISGNKSENKTERKISEEADDLRLDKKKILSLNNLNLSSVVSILKKKLPSLIKGSFSPASTKICYTSGSFKVRVLGFDDISYTSYVITEDGDLFILPPLGYDPISKRLAKVLLKYSTQAKRVLFNGAELCFLYSDITEIYEQGANRKLILRNLINRIVKQFVILKNKYESTTDSLIRSNTKSLMSNLISILDTYPDKMKNAVYNLLRDRLNFSPEALVSALPTVKTEDLFD